MSFVILLSSLLVYFVPFMLKSVINARIEASLRTFVKCWLGRWLIVNKKEEQQYQQTDVNRAPFHELLEGVMLC